MGTNSASGQRESDLSVLGAPLINSWGSAKADPDYIAQREKQLKHQQELEAKYQEDEKEILQSLRQQGFDIKSVWDLARAHYSYSHAIPILKQYIDDRSLLPATREGIVRALTVKEARGVVGQELLKELRRSTSHEERHFRWAIANALTVVADPSIKDEVERLADEEEFRALRRELKATARKLRRASPRE